MTQPERIDITRLLQAHAAGNPGALEQVLPLVYDELRVIARARLRREHGGHTLAPTELVHEAFLKLMPARVAWNDRTHFYAIASRAMRNVLIDHAMRRGAAKRGGGAAAITLPDDAAAAGSDQESVEELIALGEALSRLEQIDARQARVVECRFFGGLSIDETAEALGISPATVSRDWTFARAWLHHEMTQLPDA
jgi:RNA polymerase sigma factor (TIGR02999 family)